MKKDGHTRKIIFSILILSSIIISTDKSLFAHALQYENYAARQENLVELSAIFGELHHLRRSCEPRLESTIWRNRMQNMVNLEEPDNATHLKMVTAFNDGFQRARKQFPICNRNAIASAKMLANRGNTIVYELTQSLQP